VRHEEPIHFSEFIRTNDENAIREFCASIHPAAVGERLGALSSREIWHALTLLEPRLRAEIFGALDQEIQIQLAETVRRQDLAQIVNHMSADERVDLLKRLPEDKQKALHPALAIAAALGLQVLTATMIGAFLPLAAAKLKLDPAMVASPAPSTIVDITGLFIFFTAATLIRGM